MLLMSLSSSDVRYSWNLKCPKPRVPLKFKKRISDGDFSSFKIRDAYASSSNLLLIIVSASEWVISRLLSTCILNAINRAQDKRTSGSISLLQTPLKLSNFPLTNSNLFLYKLDSVLGNGMLDSCNVAKIVADNGFVTIFFSSGWRFRWLVIADDFSL